MKIKHRAERGQALILIVFAIVGLIGITALAVDGGNAYAENRRAQNAADAAALGGALARIRGTQDWVQVTYEIAAQNGYNNDGVTNTVNVYSPPIDGPHVKDLEYIQVKITSIVPTYFGGVVGINQITAKGETVTRSKAAQYSEAIYGNAVVALAPTSDCMSNVAFYVHGESTLNLIGGGVFVNSNNPDCALIQQGNGSIRIQDNAFPVTVVGGAKVQKPNLLSPFPPKTGAIQYPYPPFIEPKVGCDKEATIDEDGSTLHPGYWDEEFPPEGVTHLAPGNYCVNGDFIMNGGQKLDGKDITIKLEHGQIHWSGDAEITLTAPDKGDLAGLLIYAPIDNHSKIALNGSNKSKVRGTILAPGAHIVLNGSVGSAMNTQIIGYTIDAKGNSLITIMYKNEDNYDVLAYPEVQLSE